jgi:hypothetical protein
MTSNRGNIIVDKFLTDFHTRSQFCHREISVSNSFTIRHYSLGYSSKTKEFSRLEDISDNELKSNKYEFFSIPTPIQIDIAKNFLVKTNFELPLIIERYRNLRKGSLRFRSLLVGKYERHHLLTKGIFLPNYPDNVRSGFCVLVYGHSTSGSTSHAKLENSFQLAIKKHRNRGITAADYLEAMQEKIDDVYDQEIGKFYREVILEDLNFNKINLKQKIQQVQNP